jgi:uncharacterized OB-fold protein
MGQYCKQCAEYWFPDDPVYTNDFNGLTSEEDWASGAAVVVACEGCGVIQVDPEGRCVSEDCLWSHGKYEHIRT